MEFTLEEIPKKQLRLLGLDKADILALPQATRDALLSGNRTSLLRLEGVALPGTEEKIPLDAKLSLFRKPDGTASLHVHPIHREPANVFNLSMEEQGFLKKEEAPFVTKTLRDGDGKVKDFLVSLDRETNEYVAVNKEKIVAPEKIAEAKLTPEQQQDFREGKEVETEDGDKIKIDPSSETGLSHRKREFQIPSIEFAHTKYTSNELAIDLALTAMGLGHIMMIGHLANILISTVAKTLRNKREENKMSLTAENKGLRDRLAQLGGKIRESISVGIPLQADDLAAMAGIGQEPPSPGIKR